MVVAPRWRRAAATFRPATTARGRRSRHRLPFKGKEVPLAKFQGKAHLVVNIKMDDPVAGANFNAMRYVASTYPDLRVWAVPTEQGYYEPDVSELVRAKAYQQFGFGTYPTAVVFDKVDRRSGHSILRCLSMLTLLCASRG